MSEVTNKLAFLDCKVHIKENDSQDVDVYRKSTQTDQYHPLEHKLRVIRNLQYQAENVLKTKTNNLNTWEKLWECVAQKTTRRSNQSTIPTDEKEKQSRQNNSHPICGWSVWEIQEDFQQTPHACNSPTQRHSLKIWAGLHSQCT